MREFNVANNLIFKLCDNEMPHITKLLKVVGIHRRKSNKV